MSARTGGVIRPGDTERNWPAVRCAGGSAVTSAAASAPAASAITGAVRHTYLVAHGVPKNVPGGTRSPLTPHRRGGRVGIRRNHCTVSTTRPAIGDPHSEESVLTGHRG